MNNLYKNPYILYENKEFILLYKPAKWSCDTDMDISHITKYPDNNKSITIYVKFYIHNYLPYKKSYGLLNRLDKETSGCVLVAKNKNGYFKLFKIVHIQKKICKIYLCLTNNNIKKKQNYIKKSIKCDRQIIHKQTISKCNITDKNNKQYIAKSYFYKIAKLEDDDKNEYTLFFVKIFTGKTHQIRIHMKSLGCPLVSDYKYLDKEQYNENLKISSRLFLHNIFYKFTYDNKIQEQIVPIPTDLLNTLSMLKSKRKYNILDIPQELIDLV